MLTRSSVRWSSLRLLSSPRTSFQFSFQRDTSSCRSAGTNSVRVLPSTLSVTVMRREFPTIVRVTVPPSRRSRRHSVRRRETSALRSSSIFFKFIVRYYTHYFRGSQGEK